MVLSRTNAHKNPQKRGDHSKHEIKGNIHTKIPVQNNSGFINEMNFIHMMEENATISSRKMSIIPHHSIKKEEINDDLSSKE